MNYKKYLSKTMVPALILAVTGAISVNAAEKPNIIYIMCDDLGYGDLGCYGQQKIKTPEIDKLAADGMLFKQHYAGTSVCAPTRCSLMTGLHTGHSYIRANSPGYPNCQTPIPADTETVATMLKREGYATACIGKWGLGNHTNAGDPNKQGFDLFYGYYDQRRAHNYYPGFLYRNGERDEFSKDTYSHDKLTDESIRFIEANKQKPFFLYLPYCIPHTKFQVPELGEYAEKDWPKNIKTQAAMITRMDRDVGTIIQKLKELKLDRNTVVFFTSDHGAHGQGGTLEFFNASGPLREKKRSMYEGGLRVPLIVYWPGKVKAGSSSNHISAFWDMMPTLAEIGGGKPKNKHDGISFLPTLLGDTEKQKHHPYLYWELYEGKPKQAIRKGKWKAVVPNMREPNKIELYDLSQDLGEKRDIAAKSPEIVKQLRKLMDEAHEPNPFWSVEGMYNAKAACEATGVKYQPRKKKKKRTPDSK